MTTWKNNYRKNKEATKDWKANNVHAITLALVHSTPNLERKLEEKLKGNEDYDVIKTDQGVIKFLILI